MRSPRAPLDDEHAKLPFRLEVIGFAETWLDELGLELAAEVGAESFTIRGVTPDSGREAPSLLALGPDLEAASLRAMLSKDQSAAPDRPRSVLLLGASAGCREDVRELIFDGAVDFYSPALPSPKEAAALIVAILRGKTRLEERRRPKGHESNVLPLIRMMYRERDFQSVIHQILLGAEGLLPGYEIGLFFSAQQRDMAVLYGLQRRDGGEFALATGLVGLAAKTTVTVQVTDPQDHPFFEEEIDSGPTGSAELLIIPITVPGEELRGILRATASRHRPRRAKETDRRNLEWFAAAIAPVVDRHWQLRSGFQLDRENVPTLFRREAVDHHLETSLGWLGSPEPASIRRWERMSIWVLAATLLMAGIVGGILALGFELPGWSRGREPPKALQEKNLSREAPSWQHDFG